MIQKLSVALLLLGLVLVFWNGFQWWSESRVALYDAEMQDAPYSPGRGSSPSEDFVAAETLESYQEGGEIGELTIPKLGRRYPVFFGTEAGTLKEGAGLYDTSYTTLPSEKGHTALAGHRETVFRGLDGLVPGDFLYLTEGDYEYEYQINRVWVTDEQDTSVIVEKDSPTLTLTTCYPFDFIGSAPERFIVQAEFVKRHELP
ncbi:sortase [Halobacillus kuroshimensis]|uniref:sortase n=1 Tax=Halobacillus kuroshimensis TaxID=302481 RepID=UPI00041531A4|nr:sortase [Halobacillus kuroshimensis]